MKDDKQWLYFLFSQAIKTSKIELVIIFKNALALVYSFFLSPSCSYPFSFNSMITSERFIRQATSSKQRDDCRCTKAHHFQITFSRSSTASLFVSSVTGTLRNGNEDGRNLHIEWQKSNDFCGCSTHCTCTFFILTISLTSPWKQRHEMTKFDVWWRTRR